MLSATLYRYLVTLRRSPADTVSMLVSTGVSALLYAVFALFYISGSEGVGYLCVSLAVVNLITNAVEGAGFEAREDGRDERIDTVMLAPGGLRSFAWSQGLVQTVIALVQSALVLGVTALVLPGSLAPSPTGLLWAATGLVALLLVAVPWAALAAWTAVRSKNFVQMNFVTSLAVTLAGAFWPVESLPGPFGLVARVNPLTYSVDLVRASLTGSSPLLDPKVELVISLVLAVAMIAVSLAVMRRQGDLSERARV